MKILIVEDNISIRNVLRMGLEELSYAVDEAGDGERGSYLARVNKYDLIILDDILPKKLGKVVCEEIRQIGVHAPILFLSDRADVNTKIDLLNCGADDCLSKPFSFAELHARVKSLLRRPHKIQDTVIKEGVVSLNVDTHDVVHQNKKLYLTQKEFSLLELLMRNSGRIVTRSTIMESVWDINADPFSNTIETHIRNLRSKLRDRNKTLIRNIPGRGYKFHSLELQR
ncbi:MAG TPA: response regulator transcription factor [Candidatus Paceibacterota bacterium]|nr:response regulator transcription factor [Candidatus Paceibacterota bacterium]HRZ34641.1 response regulator transcription factor [Candidatus Paceibacterota bacterium]